MSLFFFLLFGLPQRRVPDAISSARSQVAMLEDAVYYYQLSVGELPPDLDALILCPAELPDPQKWIGPYHKWLHFDPWGNAFNFEVLDRSRQEFRVWSAGPDGVSRSPDDIEASDQY